MLGLPRGPSRLTCRCFFGPRLARDSLQSAPAGTLQNYAGANSRRNRRLSVHRFVPRWQERNFSNHNNNRLRVRLNCSGSDEGEEVFDDAFEVRKGLAFPLRRALTCSVGCDFPRSTTRQTGWFISFPRRLKFWVFAGRFHARSPCTRPNCRNFPAIDALSEPFRFSIK